MDQSYPETSVFSLLCHGFSSIMTRGPLRNYLNFFHVFLLDFIKSDFWKFGGRVNKNHISPHQEDVKQILPRHLICYQNCTPAFDLHFQEEKLHLWMLVSYLDQIKGDTAEKAAATRMVLNEMSFQKRSLVKKDSVLTDKIDS